MALMNGTAKEIISENIRTLKAKGKTEKQAVTGAYQHSHKNLGKFLHPSKKKADKPEYPGDKRDKV